MHRLWGRSVIYLSQVQYSSGIVVLYTPCTGTLLLESRTSHFGFLGFPRVPFRRLSVPLPNFFPGQVACEHGLIVVGKDHLGVAFCVQRLKGNKNGSAHPRRWWGRLFVDMGRVGEHNGSRGYGTRAHRWLLELVPSEAPSGTVMVPQMGEKKGKSGCDRGLKI